MASTGMDRPASLGFRGYAGALLHDRPGRLAWVVAVQAGAGLAQAAGVLLLVPLLSAVGVRTSSGIARWMHDVLRTIGIRPTLTSVLAVYVVVSAAAAALGAYQTVLAARYRLEFVDGLRARLYDALARAEWRQLMSMRQSDLLAVLTTNVGWVALGTLGALNLIVTTIVVAAQLAAAVGVSPAFTGLAILSGIALVAVVWPLVRRSRRLGTELVERNRGVLALATGFLDALKLTKAYGREDAQVKAFTQAIAAARGSQVEYARATGIATGVQLALTAVLLAVTVDISVSAVHVPIGSVLVVAFVFTRVVGQITGMQSSIQQLAQALPAFDEVVGLIAVCEAATEITPSMTTPRRISIGRGIGLRDVHFAYPRRDGSRIEALSGVSLELPAGAMVALAGPSGAGKTTIADLVAGLITPTAGVIEVDGRPLTAERLLGWRRSVALVPQDPFLFHDTIAVNLRWGRAEASDAELWEALKLAAATEFVGRLPQQLDAVVGDRGLRLAGGERQRLALARALLRGPELLILDEATSSLDTENERTIRTALSGLRGRVTMLVIAHRLSTVSDADTILVLEQGRVVEAGSWSELERRDDGRLRSLIAAARID